MNTETEKRDHVSRYFLESILAGDLNLDDHPDGKAHIDGCATCSEYIKTAADRSSGLSSNYPTFRSLHSSYSQNKKKFDIVKRVVDVFAELTAPSRIKPVAAFAVLCLLAGGVVIFRSSLTPERLYLKGAADYSLYVNGSGAGNRNGIVMCGPGDTLQLVIRSRRPVYFRVYYRDDGKDVAAYMPESPGNHPKCGGPKGEPLPQAIILDSLWEREELYCLWSLEPIGNDDALEFLKSGGDVPERLRRRLNLVKYVLEKE